jgi:two-component system sensor histidine kinase BaeS
VRTKIFLAFVVIILAALLSTVVFEFMIVQDFDDYVSGMREDQIRWIRVSVEGGYKNGTWDSMALSESIHWAMMQGLDIRILDVSGNEVIPANHYLHSLSPSMKQRMEELFHIHADTSQAYKDYQIYSEGMQIGTIKARSFQKKALAEKEAAFKSRAKYFLWISLAIAGGGALIIGFILSNTLSKPIRLLKTASEKIAAGDFSVRVGAESTDEVGNLSKAFNRMSESLQREEELRKHLLANIAHELRTPLTIMKARLEAMTDGLLPDTTAGLAGMTAEVDRLTTLVKGIEDITAAEASFFKQGELTELNLAEFLDGLLQARRPDFAAQGLELNLAVAAALPVRTDAEKLERIVGNLLSNALKYTAAGAVTVSCGADAESFFFTVRDTGRGIPADQIPHIFNRFYRGSGTMTEGLGLGLAIVKELVGVMEGRIEVSSTPGTGTAVTVFFPRETHRN